MRKTDEDKRQPQTEHERAEQKEIHQLQKVCTKGITDWWHNWLSPWIHLNGRPCASIKCNTYWSTSLGGDVQYIKCSSSLEYDVCAESPLTLDEKSRLVSSWVAKNVLFVVIFTFFSSSFSSSLHSIFLSGVLSDIFYDVLNEPNPPSDH